MRSKTTALIIAILLGLIATIAVVILIRVITSDDTAGEERKNAYVAIEPVSKGKTMDELIQSKSIEKRKIPEKYLPDDFVESAGQVSGRVLSTNLSKGEQLTENNFKKKKEEGVLPLVLEKGQLAVVVPVDEFSGVEGQIKAGDKVSIFASFEGTDPETAFTNILLSDIEVLQTPSMKDSNGDSGSSAEPGKQGLMVALTPQQAEKLVFANEFGEIWAGLQSEEGSESSPTAGTNFDSIFQ